MESKIGIVPPQEVDLAGEELEAVEKLQKSYHNMKSELGKVIVFQPRDGGMPRTGTYRLAAGITRSLLGQGSVPGRAAVCAATSRGSR